MAVDHRVEVEPLKEEFGVDKAPNISYPYRINLMYLYTDCCKRKGI